MDADTYQILRTGMIQYIILAASIALHEFGHAKAADMVGDDLPRLQGRVTLNPLNHLDPIGTGLIPMLQIFWPLVFGGGMPVAIIGWGRPVQVSSWVMSDMKKDFIVTGAGPAMNLVIALVATFVGGVILGFGINMAGLIQFLILINVVLIVFNLIPIPPLDGSHFMRHAVGMSEETYFRLSQYSIFILLVLINLQGFRALMMAVIEPVFLAFMQVMLTVAGLF